MKAAVITDEVYVEIEVLRKLGMSLRKIAEEVPTLVGIDHGFSFPLRYFEVHHLTPDWPSFLDDFQRHWQHLR